MQNLREWVSELIDSNKPIIVEGKKDKLALEKLGIKNIITFNKPIFCLVEEIKSKECVLLFDLDKEGRRIYSRFKHQLEINRIKVDNKFREFLFRGTRLSHIEGINTYIKNNLHLKEIDFR